MRELRDLTQIVTPTKLRKVPLLGKGDGDSKIRQLFDLLHDEPELTEEQLQQRIYGNTKESKAAFRKLKLRLADRLIKALFLIDLKKPSYTNRQRAYYELHQKWAAAKMLFGKHTYHTAIQLSKEILKNAERFEFTELCVDVCRQLRVYYGTVGSNVKLFQQYDDRLLLFTQIWQAEKEIEGFFLSIIMLQNTGQSNAVIAQKVAEAQKWLVEEAQPVDQYQFQLCARLVELAACTTATDYFRADKVCNDALVFFATKRYYARIPIEIFTYQRLVCLYQLQQYEQILKVAEDALDKVQMGTFNWFQYQHVQVLALIRAGQYKDALTMWQITIKKHQIKQLNALQYEQWLLLEGYFVLLVRLNKIPLKNFKTNNFKLGRFLNQFEAIRRHKSGSNIALLVVELMLQILLRERDHVVDRQEALEKYARRYLRVDGVARSYIFIRQIIRFSRVAFQTEEFVGSKKDLSASFETIPLQKENFGLEIIPYPLLWDGLVAAINEQKTGIQIIFMCCFFFDQ